MDRKVGDQRRADLAEEEETILARMYSTPDSILLIDPEGMVLAASEAALQQFKLSAKEIMGQSLFRLLPANLGRLWRERVSQAMRNGQPVRFDEDRQGLAIENSVYPLCDEHGAVTRLVLVSCDITERKRAEEKLSSSEAFLNRVIERSSESLWVSDSEGTMIRMNQACRELFGVTDEEVVGKYNLLKDNLIEEQGFMPLVEDVFKKGEIARFTIDYDLPRVEHVKVRGATYRILDVVISPIKDANGKVINVIVQHKDITERKRAEQALRESERRFRDTIKNLDEGYYCCTPEGLLLEHNVAFNQILGFDSEQDLKGEKLPDFWQNPEDRKQYLQELTSQGFVRNYLINAKKIDGEQIVVMASAHLVKDEKDRMARIEGAFTDFTERKRVEEQLARSRELLLEAEQVARLGSWEWDVVRDEITGSAEFYRLFDAGPEQIAHLPQFLGLLHADDRERVQRDLEDALEQRKMFDTDYRVILSDDEWRTINARGRMFFDEKGKPLRMVGTCMNITERKQAEEAILREKEFSDTVIDSIPGAFYLIDEKGQFVRFNKNMSKVTGYSSEELLRFKATDIIAEEDRELVAGKIGAVFKKGYENVEAHLLTKDMRKIPYYFTGIPAVIADKTYLVGMGIDIAERKRTEDALAESEKKLRALFETMSEGIVYEDHDGKIIFANPAAERLLGLSLDQMQGRTSIDPRWKAIHEDGSPFPGETHSLRVAAMTGKPGHDEVQGIYNPQSGDYVWLNINSTPEFLPGKKEPFRAFAVFRDITERRRVEEALRESEVKYRELFENAQVGMYRSKLDGSALLAVNSKLCEIFGYSEEEMLGNPATIRWADPQARDRMVTELRQAGSLRDYAMDIVRKGGEIRNCSVSVQLNTEKGYLEGSAVDVTERKQAVEAVRESAVRYHTLFNNSTDGILIVDIGAKTFKYANPALCRMFGYTEDELRTMGLPDIHPKETVQSVIAEFEALDRGDKALAPGIPCLRKDGSVFHADIGAVKITVDGMPCNLGFFRDITERKRVEEELARSNAELEQFAYVASHDLQEPLRMVSSYVQLLARHNQGKLDSDSQEFIAFATDGADRMQSLIQDLLTFSRVGTQGKPFVPTDCEAVLERALNHLKVAIEETGARITSDPLPLLRADDSQLVQLFQNLVGNALKFHRPGVPPVIHIGAERCGPDWVFAVRDNGIGIPAEQTQRVFEIFQRLQGRSQYAGTGIGLAICRKIVERHGGRIWVESAVGEGSTFTFTLPQGHNNPTPSPDVPSK